MGLLRMKAQLSLVILHSQFSKLGILLRLIFHFLSVYLYSVQHLPADLHSDLTLVKSEQ